MEDRRIVALYHRRDETAIRETERKYGSFCRAIAMNLLGSREDAEECVNDTWHTAWTRMPPEMPRSLKAYLGCITRNLSISRFRAAKAQKRYNGLELMLSELEECVPAGVSVEKAVEQKELGVYISDWLESLPAEDRILFIRRYWYGDSLQELAEERNCAPNRMARRMMRLRGELRSCLEAKGAVL